MNYNYSFLDFVHHVISNSIAIIILKSYYKVCKISYAKEQQFTSEKKMRNDGNSMK